MRLLKIAVAGILLLATVVAGALALSGVVPRAIQLVGICWAIYGLVVGVVDGLLEPAIDGIGRALMDIGLRRAGAGFSGIEALVARGHYETAAEAYRERARDPRVRAMAELRRLLDLYPDGVHLRRIRRELAELKQARFPQE